MIGSSAPASIETLAAIWARVLERPLNPNDNFFDLGGTPASAERLFLEIASACGRELPSVFIYAAPTIEAMARLLEQPQPLRVPPVLPLTSGAQAPPLFLAPGIGDTVLGLFDLVKRLQIDRAIYGLQPRGVDGVDQSIATVEGLAQYHLDAILSVQPHGPYLLAGYSQGGLVALEVARSLAARGERIALLAMVDSHPDRRFLPFGARLRFDWVQTKRRISERLGRLQRRGSAHSADDDVVAPPTIAAALQRVKQAQYKALRAYAPRYYDGVVQFIKPEHPSYFPEDPTPVWKPLVRKFDLEVVPGDHLQMMTVHAAEVAAAVSRMIRTAG